MAAILAVLVPKDIILQKDVNCNTCTQKENYYKLKIKPMSLLFTGKQSEGAIFFAVFFRFVKQCFVRQTIITFEVSYTGCTCMPPPTTPPTPPPSQL